MEQGWFDDLDTEDSEMKECTSMALDNGQWMNEQCNKGNFIICEKNISGKLINSFNPTDPRKSHYPNHRHDWANNHIHLPQQ